MMVVFAWLVVGFFLFQRLPLIIKQAWEQREKEEGDNDDWVVKLWNLLFKVFYVCLGILKNIDVIYYFLYGLFAILGTWGHPFWFAFHLSEILVRYPTLKNVTKSVFRPR